MIYIHHFPGYSGVVTGFLILDKYARNCSLVILKINVNFNLINSLGPCDPQEVTILERVY